MPTRRQLRFAAIVLLAASGGPVAAQSARCVAALPPDLASPPGLDIWPLSRDPVERCALDPSVRMIRPALAFRWRTGVPDERGDGALATSIGMNVAARAGFEATARGWQVRLLPEVTYGEQRAFPTLPPADPGRHAASSPFYAGAFSADLPAGRPGEGARARWGESGIWYRRGGAMLALLTTRPDWGPGIGEGLVFGNSAPGFTRAEVAVEWRLDASHRVRVRSLAGTVRESAYFDPDPSNDTRSVAGIRVEHSRRGAVNTDVGISRTIMDGRRARSVFESALGPARRTASDSVIELLALDARLANEASGTVAWLEVARQEPLGAIGELLRAPMEGVAFRTGISQRLTRRSESRAAWTAAVEFVVLDQPAQRLDREPNDLYTSAFVVQGWTHDGQPLGSGLGPGGQRQVAHLERSGRVWSLGLFLERSRRHEDVLYRLPGAASDLHDVQLQGGVQLGRDWAGQHVRASLSAGQRLNYLLQGSSATASGRAVDVVVFQFGLSFTPSGRQR